MLVLYYDKNTGTFIGVKQRFDVILHFKFDSNIPKTSLVIVYT
jgi:hypothetical protein